MGYFDFDAWITNPVSNLTTASAWTTWIPSWAQALASFGAVLAALYLAIHQNKIAEKIREEERLVRSQVLASEIFGAVASVKDDVDRLSADKIDTVFLTGGSTYIPSIKSACIEHLPTARIIEGDKFGSVGLGLALQSRTIFGGTPALGVRPPGNQVLASPK